MVDTVIILNEELCSMSLAFEKAGYRILAACESDEKTCDIYKKNMKSNIVCDDVTKIDFSSLPDADVIAGKLEIHDNNNLKKDAKNNVIRKRELLLTFLEVVNRKFPKAILCEVNSNAVNTKLFHDFMSELSQCYKVSYKVYNVNEIINVPVNERKEVLLIDADPQGDLTTSLGWPDTDNLPFTLADAMKKIIQDEPLTPCEGILSNLEGVDVMPSNLDLCAMETSLVTPNIYIKPLRDMKIQ